MTETCSGVSGFWINEYPNKLKSAGKAFDGVQLSLSNNHVSIKSDMNMRGYYLEDQLDNSFISSDTGRIIEDFLYIDDIRNDIGISGGEKLILKKICNIMINQRFLILGYNNIDLQIWILNI